MNRIITELQDTGLLWEVLGGLRMAAFSVGDDFVIVDGNRVIKDRLFYNPEDVRGQLLFDILRIVPLPDPKSFLQKFTVLYGECLRRNREAFPAKITFIRKTDGFIVVVEDRSELIKLEMRAVHRRKEINTYNALSRTLSRASGLHEITEGALDIIIEEMNFDAAWISLVDAKSGALRLCCFRGGDGQTTPGEASLKRYESFVQRVFSSERALLVRNMHDDPRVSPDVMMTGFNSVAGVPIISKNMGDSGGRVVGVLGVADTMKDFFSSLDIQFLITIGNLLGVAIENARLITSLQERIRQIRLINEISGVVNSSLSIGHIFRLVFSEMSNIIEFDRASITLLDRNQDRLEIFAIDTRRPTRLTKGVHAPIEGTSAGWVTMHQKPWINRDLQEEIVFSFDSVLRDEGFRSTISIPLFKDRPLGALNLDSLHAGKYSVQDLEIIVPITKHLSIGLENALLFEEITREKREWEKTFDAITDMVWIEDLRGRALRVNRAVIKKSGRAELSFIQKSSQEIFTAMQIPDQGHIPSGSPERGREQFREIRGLNSSIYYYWTYPLLSSEGKVYGVINYLKDVTEQKRLEQRLIRADKLASLGILVAGVAHEINNPLGIIAGYSEALLERAREPELRELGSFEDFPEYLETINKEIFRCKDILQTLLDFARPSAGTFRMIDINGLIKEVMLLVTHGVGTQQYTIELDLRREIPETLADPGAMRQVFLNILMNSLHFIGERGRIVITTKVEEHPDGPDFIRVSIADNGPGIRQEIIDKIFDPFFSTKAVGEGTGLGLSICHRIVSEHEGTIDVESRPGAGATFIVRIPVRTARRR